MVEKRKAEGETARRAVWAIPAGDVAAGAAEVVRLLHASLPAFRWGRRECGAWVAGPAPAPRRPPGDLTDAEHTAFLVRLAGLLSFLGAHGLGLTPDDVASLGARPSSRDVPWLGHPPAPAWRSLPAPIALGLAALRLSGGDAACGRPGEARRALEDALRDGLPPRTTDAVAAALRAADGARPPGSLVRELAGASGPGERVASDLLGLVVPRDRAPVAGGRYVAAGGAAEWLAAGTARRAPGETAFAESGPPESMEEGALLAELADGLGPDPRAEALRILAGGAAPAHCDGPPLVLVARDLELRDARSRAAWEELPRFLGSTVRVETAAEAPPPWQRVTLVAARLGREEIAGLVHLPLASPTSFSRLWEELAEDAAGDPARLLRSARARARSFLCVAAGASSAKRPGRGADVVLRAAALLGDGFLPAEAVAAAGARPDRAAAVLEEACDAGTLRRSARGALRFADDGERKRIASGLSTAERASALARLEEAGVPPVRLLLARLSAGAAPEEDAAAARSALVDAVRQGRPADAIALLERAPAAFPFLGEPLLAAEALTAAGRTAEARTAAASVDAGLYREEPRERREEEARLLARLGEAEKALALLPGVAGPEEKLARVDLLLRLRREDEAERLLAAVEPGAGPAVVRRHLLKAQLLERRQELLAAEAELRAAATAFDGVAGGPALEDLRFAAGYVALGLGRPREACAFFRSARDEARDPSRKADAHYDLSVAAAEDGALAEAEAALEEALRLYSAAGETERYLDALGQRATLALRRSDARAVRRDLDAVLAQDRLPGRAFQLLFSVPLRQRLALADGDDADGAEAFGEAVPRLAECPGHPATREILVLEGARLLSAGLPREALDRLEEAEPHPDARSGVEPLRARLAASARLHLEPKPALAGSLDAPERTLLRAEERLGRGLAPAADAHRVLAASLEQPGGAIEVATRLLEWRGRYPAFFASGEAAPFRELGVRAARQAGLDGAAARLAAHDAPKAESTRGAEPDAGLVAEDASTRDLLETVRRVASHRISVLVLGESGTGKEVVAREVHRASGRTGPFVAVNVAALVETIAEAELFGTARGAFTGADRDRAGVVEASSGGTLFLDEIGDLSPQVQAKLLRVLQEREVRRLGETRTRPVDLRLVSATHRDLERLAAEGRFRPDLLYRIAGITVSLAPLRERPRDLRALLERAFGGTPVAPKARAALLSWGWPGNVRELISAVESARALAGGGTVEEHHLPPRLRGGKEGPAAAGGRYRSAVDEAKRRVILETLAETGGNRTRAAGLLGLSRQSLLYEMKRLGIVD